MKADIDIDISTKVNKEKYGVRAIISDELNTRPHPSGIYVNQNIPIDKLTKMAAIDYKTAEEAGYIKIDMLNNTVYNGFQSKRDVVSAFQKEIEWELFEDEDFIKTLPHLANHADVVKMVAPKSMDDLADVLALIRPGKKHLLENYLKNKQITRKNLFVKGNRGMYFKKSHAYAYAGMIICFINNKHKKEQVLEF